MTRTYAALAIACGVLTLSVAAAPRCFAQFEFTPYFGVYLPTRIVSDGTFGPHVACFDDSIDAVNSDCSAPSTKRQTAAIAGGRLTGWLTPRFGLDLAFGYSPSGLRGWINEPGSFSAVSARMLARVTPLRSTVSLALIGGGALLIDGGNTSIGNAWGPVLGLDARTRVARVLSARFAVEDYFYRLHQDGPFLAGSFTQNDVVVSAGLDVALVGR